MTLEKHLLDTLDALKIAWTMHDHPAVFTVDESASLHETIAGAHTKNMFLKDSGGQFWLITLPHNIRADLKALPSIIGCKKVSFGKAEDMERLLGVTPGSVTPLAAINDVGNAVRVVLDKQLAISNIVNIHPLRNTATISISGADLVAALVAWNHEPQIVDVPAAS
jgi:Ala-tRNA(Pro) deacylase